MLQTVIAGIIIAGSVVLAVVYFIRMFRKLGEKDGACACCDNKKTCAQNKSR